MDSIKLKSFPADKFEALALLYLEKQDLSVLSPEELIERYQETVSRMRKALSAGIASGGVG